MHVIGSKIAAAAVAASIVFTSTAAVAQSAPQPAMTPNAQVQWTALSMLTNSGAIGLGGTAAQPGMVPPPPPPPPANCDNDRSHCNGVGGVPLPVIGIWLAEVALAVYILTRSHHARFVFPVSPA